MAVNDVERFKQSFGRLNVEIFITDTPAFHSKTTYIWGYPYINHEILLENQWDADNLNSVAGYFFAIRFFEDRIEIANDILGNYRVYYGMVNDIIIISDSYEYILDRMRTYSAISIDEDQLNFWKKHRYTLNDRTLFNEIKKFSPASIYIINSEGIKQNLYFRNLKRETNSKLLIQRNYEEIKSNLLSVYKENPDVPFVLFYSGGVDSTLLLFICMELNIPVNCIIIKYIPEWSINVFDVDKAKKNLDFFGIKYTVVNVDLYEAKSKYESVAIKEMLFDRHLAVHFFQAYKAATDMFGKYIVVINGQSSDSILSFGPSGFTIGNFIKRTILAFSKGPIAWLGKIASSIINVQFIMPCGMKDSSIAIMDDSNYIFAIDKKCLYLPMLKEEYQNIRKKGINFYESVRMYSKIIGFLQGSDNQVVIKSALCNGIKKVVMPFTSPEFIYNVVRYKNNYYEIFNPKYFVRKVLQNIYGYKDTVKRGRKTAEDFDMDSFIDSVTQDYITKMNALMHEKENV